MKFMGIDRVVILVKDMEVASAFLRDKLGLDITDVASPDDAMRLAFNFDNGLELVSCESLDNSPPFISRIAKRLEESDSMAAMFVLIIRVDDVDAYEESLVEKGVRIDKKVGPFDMTLGNSTYKNFKEIILHEEDCMGVTFAFSEFEVV